MEPWPSTFLLLLLLLWLQSCVSGPSSENVYRKVWRREGESLTVLCSYKNRRNRAESKAWCKVRKKKCEPSFIRSWVKGPSYSMRDDAKAKVVHITMEALRVQDSGRYWCMRNTAGNLYPLVGFQLEVYPALTTERNILRTHLTNTLENGFVTTGQVPISGPHAPFTRDVTVFTSGLLTLASGTTEPTPVTSHSFTNASGTITEHRRSTKNQPVTLSPSDARPFSADQVTTSTESRHLSSSLSTTGMYHPSTPKSSSPRGGIYLEGALSQETYLTVTMVVLTFLLVPVVLVMVYGFWKKRHMGSYSLGSDSAKPWIYIPEGPETLWKPAWYKITQ